jgi:predicted lysophospholipase L1 biosynthesis ABC-type transport system permease subunit
VINETMAKRYWPEGQALGRRFRIIESPWITVVGIAGDVHHRGLGLPTPPEMYLSQLQEPKADLSFIVRTTGDPLALRSEIRSELRAFDRNMAVGPMETLETIVRDSVGRQRFMAMALAAFSGLALTLALVGIFGVISNAVTQRTREIGIRSALGADQRQVLSLILGRAGRLTAWGLGLGLIAALGLSRGVRGLLFGVEPTDPVTFLAIAGLAGMTALMASYIPARRALRIDPVVALRNE